MGNFKTGQKLALAAFGPFGLGSGFRFFALASFLLLLFSCFFALSSEFGPAKKMNKMVNQEKNVKKKTRGLLKSNFIFNQC